MNAKVLTDAFLPFGQIVEVSLPKPDVQSATELHRGFGYVEYELTMDAWEAIDNMDQSELFGRVIKVAQANPQKHASENLGSRTAIWEQEGYLAKHAVHEEDRLESNDGQSPTAKVSEGVEQIDVAGPREA